MKSVIRVEGAYSFPEGAKTDEALDRLMEAMKELAVAADGGSSSVERLYPADDVAVPYLLRGM